MCKNTEIYEIITKKVIEQLEQALKTGEKFQWIKEWNGIPLGNAISYLGKNFIPDWVYDGLVQEKKRLDIAKS